jgi:hypothetical protein
VYHFDFGPGSPGRQRREGFEESERRSKRKAGISQARKRKLSLAISGENESELGRKTATLKEANTGQIDCR